MRPLPTLLSHDSSQNSSLFFLDCAKSARFGVTRIMRLDDLLASSFESSGNPYPRSVALILGSVVVNQDALSFMPSTTEDCPTFEARVKDLRILAVTALHTAFQSDVWGRARHGERSELRMVRILRLDLR